jgi:hypothetical protein
MGLTLSSDGIVLGDDPANTASAGVRKRGYLLSRHKRPAEDAELISTMVPRGAFASLLGAALIASLVLLAYSSQAPHPLIKFRAAVQISGWLCVLAVLVGFSARVARRRRELGEVLAATTAFFTGAAMLYVSYYEWSEVPMAAVAARPLVAKTAAPIPKSSAPIAKATQTPAPAHSTALRGAAVGGTAKASVPAHERPRLLVAARSAVVIDDRCAGLTGAASLQCLRCSEATGLSGLFCQERARLEYCDGRGAGDPACPSVIPASPAR